MRRQSEPDWQGTGAGDLLVHPCPNETGSALADSVPVFVLPEKRTVIVRAAVEKPLLNHSMISASVVSEVMYLLDGRCELSNNLA